MDPRLLSCLFLFANFIYLFYFTSFLWVSVDGDRVNCSSWGSVKNSLHALIHSSNMMGNDYFLNQPLEAITVFFTSTVSHKVPGSSPFDPLAQTHHSYYHNLQMMETGYIDIYIICKDRESRIWPYSWPKEWLKFQHEHLSLWSVSN